MQKTYEQTYLAPDSSDEELAMHTEFIIKAPASQKEDLNLWYGFLLSIHEQELEEASQKSIASIPSTSSSKKKLPPWPRKFIPKDPVSLEEERKKSILSSVRFSLQEHEIEEDIKAINEAIGSMRSTSFAETTTVITSNSVHSSSDSEPASGSGDKCPVLTKKCILKNSASQKKDLNPWESFIWSIHEQALEEASQESIASIPSTSSSKNKTAKRYNTVHSQPVTKQDQYIRKLPPWPRKFIPKDPVSLEEERKKSILSSVRFSLQEHEIEEDIKAIHEFKGSMRSTSSAETTTVKTSNSVHSSSVSEPASGSGDECPAFTKKCILKNPASQENDLNLLESIVEPLNELGAHKFIQKDMASIPLPSTSSERTTTVKISNTAHSLSLNKPASGSGDECPALTKKCILQNPASQENYLYLLERIEELFNEIEAHKFIQKDMASIPLPSTSSKGTTTVNISNTAHSLSLNKPASDSDYKRPVDSASQEIDLATHTFLLRKQEIEKDVKVLREFIASIPSAFSE